MNEQNVQLMFGEKDSGNWLQMSLVTSYSARNLVRDDIQLDQPAFLLRRCIHMRMEVDAVSVLQDYSIFYAQVFRPCVLVLERGEMWEYSALLERRAETSHRKMSEESYTSCTNNHIKRNQQ